MRLSNPRPLRPMRKPPRVMLGDTIMIVSPASPPLSPDLFSRAEQRFTNLGYRVVLGSHARDINGFLAGKDSHRLSDLNRALRSKQIKAILCTRGGYGTGRILPSLDFPAVQHHPKALVGCSDLTTLLCGFALESRVVSFHGPTLQSLMEKDCPDFTWQRFLGSISGDDRGMGSILRGYSNAAHTVDVIRSGKVSGTLLAGNLSVLLSLVGTRWMPSLKGCIVCLEEVGESPFRVDRYLTQLLNLGFLQTAEGFALGIFERCSYRPEEVALKQSIRDVIVDRLKPLGKPIVMGLPFGHVPWNATLPVGVTATLDGRRGDLIIEECPVDWGKNR